MCLHKDTNMCLLSTTQIVEERDSRSVHKVCIVLNATLSLMQVHSILADKQLLGMFSFLKLLFFLFDLTIHDFMLTHPCIHSCMPAHTPTHPHNAPCTCIPTHMHTPVPMLTHLLAQASCSPACLHPHMHKCTPTPTCLLACSSSVTSPMTQLSKQASSKGGGGV